MATRSRPELRGRAGTACPDHPADRCPYERPFPPGFSRCPAFSPVAFQPLDSRDRALEGSVTCAHLAVGGDAGQGRFYPRCALGRVPEPADR